MKPYAGLSRKADMNYSDSGLPTDVDISEKKDYVLQVRDNILEVLAEDMMILDENDEEDVKQKVTEFASWLVTMIEDRFKEQEDF